MLGADIHFSRTFTRTLFLQLSAQNYRVSALEEQLDASAQEYGREIARLRTKLFELEMTAALANPEMSANEGLELQGGFSEMEDASFPSGSSVKAASALRSNDVASLEAKAEAGIKKDANPLVSDDVSGTSEPLEKELSFKILRNGVKSGDVSMSIRGTHNKTNFSFSIVNLKVTSLTFENDDESPVPVLMNVDIGSFVSFTTSHQDYQRSSRVAGAFVAWEFNDTEHSFSCSRQDLDDAKLLAVVFRYEPPPNYNWEIGSGEIDCSQFS